MFKIEKQTTKIKQINKKTRRKQNPLDIILWLLYLNFFETSFHIFNASWIQTHKILSHYQFVLISDIVFGRWHTMDKQKDE